MRNIYSIPDFRKLDQGMIFNGALASNYKGRNVLGVIISPRCDLAHKKNNEVHYLPIVSLIDWLAVDGKNILLEMSRNESHAKLKGELKKNEIDDSILRNNKIIELEIIIEKLIPKESKRKPSIEHLKKLKLIDEFDTNIPNKADILNFYKREEKHIKGILKDLIENKKKEFYLLDPIDEFSRNSYYVVLNREIKRLNYSFAERMNGGVFISEMEELEKRYCDIDYKVSDGFIEPIKILKSPFMEHLIQHFMSNFNRIGVTDHENNLIESLIQKINYDEILIY